MKDVLLVAPPTGLPTLMVLAGILLNQDGINRLDARITGLKHELRA